MVQIIWYDDHIDRKKWKLRKSSWRNRYKRNEEKKVENSAKIEPEENGGTIEPEENSGKIESEKNSLKIESEENSVKIDSENNEKIRKHIWGV